LGIIGAKAYIIVDPMDNSIVLGYWGLRGRAQVPRLLLAYTGINFTNKTYTSPEQWFGGDKQKLGLDFPNIPYLIDGKLKITESEAISRYIIKKSGKLELLGKNLADEGLVDTMIGVIGDITVPTLELCFNPKFNEEKAKIFTDKIKPKLELLYKFLLFKDWLTGYLTFADFQLVEIVNYLNGIWPDDIKQQFPKLLALKDRFNNLEAIKSYYAKEDAVKGPFLPPTAKWFG